MYIYNGRRARPACARKAAPMNTKENYLGLARRVNPNTFRTYIQTCMYVFVYYLNRYTIIYVKKAGLRVHSQHLASAWRQ